MSEIPRSCHLPIWAFSYPLSLVWRVGRFTFRTLRWNGDRSLCRESRIDRMGNWALKKKSPNEHTSNSHSVRALIGRNAFRLQLSTRKRSEFEVKVRRFQETQNWEVEVRQFCKTTEWESRSHAVSRVYVKGQGSSLRIPKLKNEKFRNWEPVSWGYVIL